MRRPRARGGRAQLYSLMAHRKRLYTRPVHPWRADRFRREGNEMKIAKYLRGTPSYLAKQWPKIMGSFIDYAHIWQSWKKRKAIVFPPLTKKLYSDMTNEAQDVTDLYVQA